jgi:competence protein ComEC
MDFFYATIGAFALGILLQSVFEIPHALLLFLGITGAGLFVTGIFLRRPGYFLIAIICIAFSLGVLRMAAAPQKLPASLSYLIGTQAPLEGVIATDPDIRETTQRVTIEITREKITTRILAVAPLYPRLGYGQHVRVSGGIELPKTFDTDGGRVFDYPKFLAKDGVFAMISRARITVVTEPAGFITRIRVYLYNANHAFSRALSEALPEPEAGLAVGIIAGGKQGLGKNLLAAFTTAGIVQIVVLSGYNVMIIAEAILKALSFLPRRISFVAASSGILAFIVAAGSGSSALRAGLMACLALFARASGRTYDVLRALCFVLFILALWNPMLLAYDPGFELSWIATLGLILGSPIVEKKLLFIKNNFLRDTISTTIAAELFVLPLLLYQTGNLSIVSVPANVLVSFFVPAAMALSAFAGGISLLFPSIATFVGLPAYALLYFIIKLATFAASLSFASIIIPGFSFVLVILTYAALAYLVWRQSKEKTPAA